jgi:hypothetical protein
MTLNGVSGAAAAYAAQSTKSVGRDADGDNDGSKSAAPSSASKIGPAVIMSLSNTAPDAAQGDPDGDGK